MRKISFVLATAVAVVFASCSGNVKEQDKGSEGSDTQTNKLGNINIDPAKSVVFWTGEALGVYKHTGTVNLVMADLKVDNGEIVGGSFAVDLSSITPTDENYTPSEGYTKEKLVGHLSSPDFFDVANHPEATFKISSMEGTTATGILTVRGISLEEKVENINVMKEGNMVKISGDLVFNRKNYDVSWDYPMKDRILSKDIAIRIELAGEEV